MKKLLPKILFLILFVFFFFLYGLNKEVHAYKPLDYINYYEIKIDPRQDGTLDMHFEIQWTVLDSSSEGPLEWVKIGIPNYHVDELTANSSNIESIDYLSSSGSYIEIYFDRYYYEGESITFSFSIHQSRMYFLSDDQLYYHYVPGWFDEIQVGQAVVMWNKKNVVSNNSMAENDEYYIWSSPLNYGQTMKIEIQYNQSSFIGLSEELQYTDAYMTPREKILIIGVIILFVGIFVTVVIVSHIHSDPYMNRRGFIGHRYYSWYHPRIFYGNGKNSKGKTIINPTSSGYKGGSGGSCACACACACAGGGRAGCSLKDFYKTNLNSKNVIKKIDKIEV